MEQDIVVESRIFPLFPLSFQHSTSEIHIVCGKIPDKTPFNISFTAHSQPRGKQNFLIIPEFFRLFNIFPTPYYEYYNKFNIENRICHPNPRETTNSQCEKQFS